MLHIYCPVCHGRLELQENQTEAVCLECGNMVPVPKAYDELESFFNYAFEARSRRDFTAAEQSYGEILKKHPDSAAAHWGRALSRYGIEYQPIGGSRYRLVCHRALEADFLTDEDVEAALGAGDSEAETYREEAEQIAKLQAEVRRVSSVAEPCDVLIIAAAENAEAQKKAAALVPMVKAAGLRASNPAADLKQIPRQDWEPHLYHAFRTAGTLLVAASGADSFPPDVLFDVQRFLSRKAAGERAAEGKTLKLVLVFENLDEYEDIPDEIFETFDVRLSAAAQDFGNRLAENLSGGGRDYGEAVRKSGVDSEDRDYVNAMKRARLALEKGEFEKAGRLYEYVLGENPKESQAYWGQLLCQYGCRSEKELIEKRTDIRADSRYRSAVAFAPEREQQIYTQIAEDILEAISLRNRQKEAAKQEKEEQQKERKRQSAGVQEALKKTEERESAAKKKSLRASLAVVVLAAALIGGGIWYYYRTEGAKWVAYDKASTEYSMHNYQEAAEIYKELGDYKDSENLFRLSQAMSEYMAAK